MRLSLLLLFSVFALSPTVTAQKVVEAWYYIESDAGPQMIQAREIQTHTDRSGRTQVTADGDVVRTEGPVIITPLGAGRNRPEPPPQTQSESGTLKSLLNFKVHSPRFQVGSFKVLVEGRQAMRMMDITTQNHATTTTSTSNGDGSTSTSTTTEEGGGEEGESSGGEEGGDTSGGDD